MEQERFKEVVIDTYALMAIVYDEVGSNALRVLKDIKAGRTRGLVPSTVAYEYIVHWLRGRIPELKSIDEVVTYLRSYFKIIELSFRNFIEAAKIKVEGDNLLKSAKREDLRFRRLSIVDSTVIALALEKNTPIVTGDEDLAYVANAKGIETIW